MSAQTTTGGVPERKVPPNSIRGAAMRGVVARPGHEAVEVKGWLRAHKWLLLRRASQLGILALFLAGLRSVDQDLVKAAQIDGAGVLRTYRKVILPTISPIFIAVAVVLLQFAIKTFDLVAALTGGFPVYR